MIKLLVICHPSTCSGVFSCCHLCFAVLGAPLLIHHNGLGIYSALDPEKDDPRVDGEYLMNDLLCTGQVY